MRRDPRYNLARWGNAARGAACALLLLAPPGQAQDTGSLSDYRLPPAPAPAPAPVEGPVDSDHPVAAPTRPAPAPAPLPERPSGEAAAPAPPITLPPAAAPGERPQGSRARTLPRTPAETAPVPLPEPATPPPVVAASPPADTAAADPVAASQAPVRPAGGWSWLHILAGAIGLAAIIGLLWLRRRRAPPQAETEEAAGLATASAPATLPPVSQAPARPVPRTSPSPPASDPLALRFEPKSLRLSFVYATLAYRLTLTNCSESAFAELRLTGDLASGHASVPMWQQLSLDGAPLAPQHEVAELVPGETIAFDGELQLPLAEVLPLRAGAALLFAPLARFRIALRKQGNEPLNDTHIFTIGLPSDRRGGTMQPFRLDHGPQLFSRVDQREVDIARWLSLDEQRQAS